MQPVPESVKAALDTRTAAVLSKRKDNEENLGEIPSPVARKS